MNSRRCAEEGKCRVKEENGSAGDGRQAYTDKVDRLETMVKKKNLIIEGIPESADRRENMEKTVGDLFDELSVGRC